MTQNVTTLKTEKGDIRVCIGWDRPLKELFCNLDLVAETEDEDTAYLAFPFSFPGGLPEIREALTNHGLKVPEVVFTTTLLDSEMNLGNVVREFSPEGTLLVEHHF